MAHCDTHNQTYDPTKQEWCVICGNPKDYLYPLSEVCKRLSICRKSATAWFAHEKDVVPWPGSGIYNPKKKRNVTLRIPGHVIDRVVRQFANKEPVRRIS